MHTQLQKAYDVAPADGIRSTTATISTSKGDMDVEAWDPGDTPGLIVTRATTDQRSKWWSVTHIRSGLMVGASPYRTRTQAIRCARALASLADWDRPRGELSETHRDLARALPRLRLT